MGEVDVEPRPAGQPAAGRGGLVGRVVVEDEVHVELGGPGLVDGVQELPELHGAVAMVELADDRAAFDIERGDERGGPVARVVVGQPLGLPRPHRQHRLGPVERLDLSLLIDAQQQRPLRRIQVIPTVMSCRACSGRQRRKWARRCSADPELEASGHVVSGQMSAGGGAVRHTSRSIGTPRSVTTSV